MLGLLSPLLFPDGPPESKAEVHSFHSGSEGLEDEAEDWPRMYRRELRFARREVRCNAGRERSNTAETRVDG